MLQTVNRKIRAVFSKTGDMRFISHLDLVRIFQRASRRAGLPISMTHGFSPHLKISITRALKLGLESTNEEAVFYTDKDLKPDQFLRSMNEKLPDGIRIVRIEETR